MAPAISPRPASSGGLLGTAVLWAVVFGAILKFVVTEGLARWQLATGETLIEGAVSRLGRGVIWLFMPYLLLWSFFVGSALMSATGVTLHAMLPIFDDADRGKVVFGIASSLAGLVLVWFGGYRLFEQVMRGCIVIMFLTVMLDGGAAMARNRRCPRGSLHTAYPGRRRAGDSMDHRVDRWRRRHPDRALLRVLAA